MGKLKAGLIVFAVFALVAGCPGVNINVDRAVLIQVAATEVAAELVAARPEIREPALSYCDGLAALDDPAAYQQAFLQGAVLLAGYLTGQERLTRITTSLIAAVQVDGEDHAAQLRLARAAVAGFRLGLVGAGGGK